MPESIATTSSTSLPVLVTGASGFIGSHLVHRLQAMGTPARALLRRTSRTENLDDGPDPGAISRSQRYAALDDVPAMAEAMQGCEIVYHVAGLTAAYDRASFDRVNVEGLRCVIAAIRQAARMGTGPRRLLVCSSSMAAGPCHPSMPRREQHRVTRGFTDYGESKLLAENVAWEAAQEGLEVVVVRPPLVYGPRDRDVFQIIRAANSRIVPVPGGVDAPLSAIHVHDLVEGMILAATRGQCLPQRKDAHVLAGDGLEPHVRPRDPCDPLGEGIYYFTDGEQHTVASLGLAAARALGKRAFRLNLPRGVVLGAGRVNEIIGRVRGRVPALTCDKARGSLSTGWWYDDSRAREQLGYRAELGLAVGLENTVSWLRAQGWL